MDDAFGEKLAKNEALFREVNEAIERESKEENEGD